MVREHFQTDHGPASYTGAEVIPRVPVAQVLGYPVYESQEILVLAGFPRTGSKFSRFDPVASDLKAAVSAY